MSGRRRDLEPPVGDQRDVERGAADVGAERVRDPEPLGDPLTAHHAADRPGHQRSRQLPGLDRDRAAVRGHHPQLEAGAGLLGLVADRLQRAARGLGRVGLDQGRVEPRQVAALRIELRGEEHRDLTVVAPLRLLLLEDLPHPDLVLGVAVGEQQADADPVDAGVEQLGGGLARVLLAKRRHLLAEHVDPPAHPLHPLARHQGRVVVVGREVEAVGVRVAEVGLDPALDLQVVLLPGGDDRADLEALAREQPVEHRGAAVDARGDRAERLLRRRIPLLQGVAGRLHEADRLVVGRRLRLADHERSRLVDDERVGHRPAGVDREDSGPAAASIERESIRATPPASRPPDNLSGGWLAGF